MFHTIIITSDNREITIPNGQIISAPIENLTVLGRRRVDMVLNVLAVTDIAQLKETLAVAIAADSRIHPEPKPLIEVVELTDVSTKLWLRPWTDADSYSAVAAATMGAVREALSASGHKFSITLQSLIPAVPAA